ncbi:MAG: SEC59/DGK1/VTE5 family protein [Candidatus Methanoperedens sp.]|nr:SEC59/DGK1/VTE5 family protein [Candidatus Methanoperedens sp.]MCZ7403648.1 SEC59/DGK1/VTE5 family protein [Candidatus Methanoperedens sp.]
MLSNDLINELKRKTVHLTSIIIVLTYYYFGKQVVLSLLTVFLILILELEYFRIEWGKKLPLVHGLFRTKEADRLGGHVFLAIGSIIAISVFPKEIASAAVLMTTFGDASAAIFGKAFGRTWIPGLKDRAIEGCAAEFIVNIIIGWIFLPGWIAILVMAGTATVVETLTNKMDDNLLIPLFSGFNGQVAFFILGYFK